MLRRWVQFSLLYLALASQALLPLAQWIHETTADVCGAGCTICNPGAQGPVTAASAGSAAAGRELLFDVAAAPSQSPARSLRATLQLAMAQAQQNGRTVPGHGPSPAHDPANCLICLQLAQCRSADRPPMPVALPTPVPAITQMPVAIVVFSQAAPLPLPPARAPPVCL
jgi:hypothetical protein